MTAQREARRYLLGRREKGADLFGARPYLCRVAVLRGDRALQQHELQVIALIEGAVRVDGAANVELRATQQGVIGLVYAGAAALCVFDQAIEALSSAPPAIDMNLKLARLAGRQSSVATLFYDQG